MSYSCLEELQVDLDLHTLDKKSVLSKAGRRYDDGWLVITNNGYCHLFDKDGNLDNIKKITQLKEEYIRKDIKKIVIPDSAMSIGEWAFYDCEGLMSVTIPDSVTSIGNYAFQRCDGLTSVTFGNGVTSIGYRVFKYCYSLTSVMIGSSVMSIKYDAFYNCHNLTTVTFKGKTLKQVKKMDGYPFGIKDESIIKVE